MLINLSTLKAQFVDIPIPKYEYDTNYIVNYEGLMAIRLVSPRRMYNFRLKNSLTGDKITYRPNLQTAFGIGVTYKWLALDMTFNPKLNRSKTDKYGHTNEFNLKGTIYLKRHLLDVLFRRYKGLYIANPDKIVDPWDGTYPQRPDLISSNMSFSYTIPLNYREYAPKTTFLLDGRMKKSAGSVMLTSFLHFASVKADSSIVPIDTLPSFGPNSQINKMNLVLLQQTVGYAYTFVHQRFYLTLSLLPGLSFITGKVTTETGAYNPASINFMLESKNGIGYNSRKWYVGLYYIYKYQNVKLQDDLAYNSNLGEIRFFIGYRLHAPFMIDSVIR